MAQWRVTTTLHTYHELDEDSDVAHVCPLTCNTNNRRDRQLNILRNSDVFDRARYSYIRRHLLIRRVHKIDGIAAEYTLPAFTFSIHQHNKSWYKNTGLSIAVAKLLTLCHPEKPDPFALAKCPIRLSHEKSQPNVSNSIKRIYCRYFQTPMAFQPDLEWYTWFKLAIYAVYMDINSFATSVSHELVQKLCLECCR